MIQRLRRKFVNWSAFGWVPDTPDYGPQGKGEAAMEYDDYRRRIQQEAATRRRIARLRLIAFLKRKRTETRVA